MNQKAIKAAQRVLRYERQQLNLMRSRIAKTRADITSIDHRIRCLQSHILSNLTSRDSVCANELHGRENLISYEARVDVQVGKLRKDRERLVEELVPAEKNLVRKRARVKSIETLVERSQAALAQEREFHAGIELSDLVLGSFTKETS